MKKISAYLIHEKTIYYAAEGAPVSADFPFTAVTQLIEGIWNQFSEQALKILRNRIFTAQPLTPLCEGMIRVAAKRCTEVQAIDSVALFKQSPSAIEIHAPQFSVDAAGPAGKDVGATLFSPEGNALLAERNINFHERTQHAELRLVRLYLKLNRRLIPAHSKIVVGLKPCAMCAAQIFTFAENPHTIEIHYEKDDPGPMASNSVFMKGSSLHQKAGSPVLKRYISGN